MSRAVCLYCGSEFDRTGAWGSKPFSRHVERCGKATAAERRAYRRTGRWPKKKAQGEGRKV